MIPTFWLLISCASLQPHAQTQSRIAPPPHERQLPTRMHSAMENGPLITVGQSSGDIMGKDQRALQAAVDYIAALGGGTVRILSGNYIMHDSLHLRPLVNVQGDPDGQTVLRKSDAATSDLVLDGDFGEEQVTLESADGFEVGYGIAVWDKNAGGFHTTVARITGKKGNTLSISKPLNADCMVQNGATAATVFPVVSGYDLEGVTLQNIIVDGNKSENIHLNGCRGAGIFLYRGFGTVIDRCAVRNYFGDGFSFQQSNDVVLQNCLSEDNTHLGFHPGSGSQRPTVANNIARRNGEDGLFLCWRVRHGLFENNLLEENGRFGISIGHKDTDNLLRKNIIRNNDQSGVFFRDESYGMAGHRNRLEDNIIENNARSGEGAGIRVRGETDGLELIGNIIQDARPEGKATQKIGILIESKVGQVNLINNVIQAETAVKDRRDKPTSEQP